MRDFPESECTDDTLSILHFGCQTTEMAGENAKILYYNHTSIAN